MTTKTETMALFGEDPAAIGLPPIATKLQAYLEAGGSIDGAVSFVAALERADTNKGVARQQTPEQGSRGRRLPADWNPSASEIRFAAEKGLSLDRALIEAEKFRNYWMAKSGAGAVKRDWSATWRNWIIAAVERIGASFSYPSSKHAQVGSEAVLAGMGRLARSIDERRMSADVGGRELSDGDDAAPRLSFDRRTTRSD